MKGDVSIGPWAKATPLGSTSVERRFAQAARTPSPGRERHSRRPPKEGVSDRGKGSFSRGFPETVSILEFAMNSRVTERSRCSRERTKQTANTRLRRRTNHRGGNQGIVKMPLPSTSNGIDSSEPSGSEEGVAKQLESTEHGCSSEVVGRQKSVRRIFDSQSRKGMRSSPKG